MTQEAANSGTYEQQQAAAWKNQDMVEAHRLARREGDDEMKDILVGAAELTVQAHVNRCEVEDCDQCKTAAILGIKRTS